MNKPCSILNFMNEQMTPKDWSEDLLLRIRENVAKYRKALRLTADELSDLTKTTAGYPIPRSTIANLERGGKKTLSIFELRALEYALGVDRLALERDLFTPGQLNRSSPKSAETPNYRVFLDQISQINREGDNEDLSNLQKFLHWINELTESRDTLARTKLEGQYSLPKFLTLAEADNLPLSDDTWEYLATQAGKASASFELEEKMMSEKTQNLLDFVSQSFPKEKFELWEMQDHVFRAPVVPIAALFPLHKTEGVDLKGTLMKYFGVADFSSSWKTFKYSEIDEMREPYEKWFK